MGDSDAESCECIGLKLQCIPSPPIHLRWERRTSAPFTLLHFAASKAADGAVKS